MRRPKSEPPRPSNCFVLFKNATKHLVNKDLEFGKKSKEAGRMWKEASEETKNVYKALAAEAKAAHAIQYPGYKFKPVSEHLSSVRHTTKLL